MKTLSARSRSTPSLNTQPPSLSAERLPLPVSLSFAPLHKRAFGTATGTAAGLSLFVLTLVDLLRNPADRSPLELLNEYFAGYTVSVTGAFVGLLWGFGTAFILGWFVAFCRNFVLAASIFWIRTRAQLTATRDFLDHI